MNHSQSVRMNRRRSGLSQGELAALLSMKRTTLTRLDAEHNATSLMTAFGLQVIFGHSPRQMFPHLYTKVEDAVMKRAATLDVRLRGKRDAKSKLTQDLLSDMVKRATANTKGV